MSDLIDYTRKPDQVLRLRLTSEEQRNKMILAVATLVEKLGIQRFTSSMEYAGPPASMVEIEGGDPHCGFCYNRLTDSEHEAEHPDSAEGHEHCKECRAFLGGYHGAVPDKVKIVSIVESGQTHYLLLVDWKPLCGISTGKWAQPLRFPCPGAAFREYEVRTVPGMLQKLLAKGKP